MEKQMDEQFNQELVLQKIGEILKGLDGRLFAPTATYFPVKAETDFRQ